MTTAEVEAFLKNANADNLVSASSFESGSSNLQSRHVTFDAAEQYARFLQDAYQGALQSRANNRRNSNLATIFLGITTLGLEATETGGDTTLITGLTASALGISGQTLATRDHETAYSLGAQTIGCVISAATNSRPSALPHELPAVLLRRIDEDYNELRFGLAYEARRNSQQRIASVDRQISLMCSGPNNSCPITNPSVDRLIPYQSQAASASASETCYRQIDAIDPDNVHSILIERQELCADWLAKEQVLSQFEATTDTAIRYRRALLETLQKEGNLLGDQLLNKVEDIRWQVNDAVRRSQPDLLVLDANLRSILAAQPPFVGRTLPTGFEPTNDNGEGVLASRNDDPLFSEWLSVSSKTQAIAASLSELSSLMKKLSESGALRFPENTFNSCASNELAAISEPSDISISPASFTVNQASGGQTLVSTISGGRQPYGARPADDKDSDTRATVNGSLVRLTLPDSLEDRTFPIQIIVSDVSGRGTVLTVNVEPTAEEQATTGPAEDVAGEDTRPSLLTGREVSDIQTFLSERVEDTTGQPGGWFASLTDAEIVGLTAETDDGSNGFVDGGLGPVTRRVIKLYLTTFRTTDLSNWIASAPSSTCGSAIQSLKGAGARLDTSDPSFLYTDEEAAQLSIVDADRPLVSFLTSCPIISGGN